MEARTAYGRYTGRNNLREPHGNRDRSALHRWTVGGGIGRTVRSVDGVRLERRYQVLVDKKSERWRDRLKERLPSL